MGRAGVALLGLLAWLPIAWLGGCGAEPEPVYRAPAEARAALVLEPPGVAVGEVAALDLAVITAPGATLRPVELPSRVDGFYVLEREPLRVVKEPARWVHHLRLRLRAMEVGRFEFPGGSLELETPEGGSAVLSYEPLPLEVVSVLASHARRESPYGLRMLAGSRDGPGTLGAFAAGALLALASVAVWLLVRRRLDRPPEVRQAAPADPPAWEIARSDLERARAMRVRDPRRALDLGARALRRYAVRRFGGDAHRRTTEELAVSAPPFTLTTRWPRFLELLAALDAARFPARQDAERARALLDRVDAFVEDTAPREPGA